MGIYSTNRYDSLGNYNVEPAYGYNGEIGAAIAAIECTQNDLALFNGIITADFNEACMVQEGASSEEIAIIQEGALSGAWEKLKAFFKKLWEKIKGIFHAFIAKMNSVFMKDSKEFYKKYIKEINGKTDWEDFKCKVRAVKENETYKIPFKDGDVFVEVISKSEAEIKKDLDNWDSEDEFADVVGIYISGLNAKNINNAEELKKEYFDQILDDEETKDDWKSTDITDGYIGAVLRDTKILSDLEKENKKIDAQIKKLISDIDKEKTKLSKVDRDSKDSTYTQVQRFRVSRDKTSSSDTDWNKFDEENWNRRKSYANASSAEKANASNYNNNDKVAKNEYNGKDEKFKENLNTVQLHYNLMSKKANVIQSVFTAYASASVECVKYICAQARRVFAAAVAYNPKKNEQSLVDAVGDAAFYEATQLMDSMYYIED